MEISAFVDVCDSAGKVLASQVLRVPAGDRSAWARRVMSQYKGAAFVSVDGSKVSA